jgi:hypothetical protein
MIGSVGNVVATKKQFFLFYNENKKSSQILPEQ